MPEFHQFTGNPTSGKPRIIGKCDKINTMNETALHRALVVAGSPEDLASEAATGIDDSIKRIDENIAELKATVRMMTGLIIAIFLLIVGLYFK